MDHVEEAGGDIVREAEKLVFVCDLVLQSFYFTFDSGSGGVDVVELSE